MDLFVSVIVPIYNIEKYLHRCIDSILCQTYSNFELILVDDGSTDSSGNIADEYGVKDSRVTVIHKVNGGSSSARNLAVKTAKGDYISFVDSDDYIEPDFLEKLIEPVNKAIEAGSIIPQIVQIGRNEIDEEGNILPDICTPPTSAAFIDNKSFLKDLLMHVGDCSFCTKLTKKELLLTYPFPEGKLNEDFHILVNMLKQCNGIMSLPGYKYHVFYRIGSNTRKQNHNEFSRVFKDNVDNADMVEKIVEDYFPELMDIAKRFALFQRIDYMLHIPISEMTRDNKEYCNCINYLQKNILKGIVNKYLLPKNKLYMLIFATSPKVARIVHKKCMEVRINNEH